MHWIFSNLLIVSSILLLITSASTSENPNFIQNHVDFAIHFYSNLANSEAGKSVAFSPFSIQSLFSLLYMGTKGAAAEELQRGFHLGTSDRQVIGNNFKEIFDKYKTSQELKIASKVYVDPHAELVPQFKEIASESFQSETESTDLTKGDESATIVNNWVRDKTNGKVDKLLEPADFNSDTRLILLNLIYFKGNWKHPFNKDATSKQEFWITPTESIEIDTMILRTELGIKKFADLKTTVVHLPYADSDLCMFLLIPTQRDGLSNLESKIQGSNLPELLDVSKFSHRSIELSLPKFKVESTINLKDLLQKLGVETVFKGGDFNDLAKTDKDLKVFKAIHKAVVEVNEEGTEAAASTGAVIGHRTGPLPVRADRPFLFVIKDITGHNFFIGRFYGK